MKKPKITDVAEKIIISDNLTQRQISKKLESLAQKEAKRFKKQFPFIAKILVGMGAVCIVNEFEDSDASCNSEGFHKYCEENNITESEISQAHDDYCNMWSEAESDSFITFLANMQYDHRCQWLPDDIIFSNAQ